MNIKNWMTRVMTHMLAKSGGTMTGQLQTSFKNAVAGGSYGSSQSTVEGLVDEVRFSSGCSGSASIGTAYTKDNVTIATGWYNFLWIPHRSGGANGNASGDNCNYGNLFLFGMNNKNGKFVVRVSSASIQEVSRIITTIECKDYVVEQGTNYRKWNSGIAECWIRTSKNVALNNAYGSLYQGTWSWTFPITFTEAPTVVCSQFQWGTGASWGTAPSASATTASLRGIDVLSRASGACEISAYAIGKWK